VQDENNEKSIKISEIALMFCFIALVVSTVVLIAWKIDKNTKDNQLVTLKCISEKITANMKDYFHNQWNPLKVAERYIQSAEPGTVKETLENLGAAEALCGLKEKGSIMLLIDNKGYYYTVRLGKGTLWSRGDRLKDSQAIFVTSMAEIKDNIDEYICFCKKLDRTIVTKEGVQFTHIIMAADERAFDIDLSLSEFGNITDAFVMCRNGRKINAQTENTNMAKAYNLVDALSDAEYLLGNSYEEIKALIEAGESGSALIRYEGDTYFVAFHNMGIEDWYAGFIVERNDMTSDVKPFICHLVGIMAISFAIIIVFVVALLMLRRKHEKKREKIMQDNLRNAALAADKANEAKSVFLSRMSHDIRTPINGIIGMTAIAKKRIEDRDSVESCLKKISVASNHLLELVNEVLDISRIESGKVVLENAPFNLRDMLDSVSDILESRISAKHLSYSTDFEGISNSYIEGCENLLKQILINILDNAMKYTNEGGRIFFKVYNDKPEQALTRYHFVVEDTGIGINSEYLEHIFDRFSQEKSSARTNYEGTGLGLSIVKELTDLMGGEVLISSEIGVGSIFEVVIPFCLLEEVNAEGAEQEITADEIRRFHVILAEDNEINKEVAEFLLSNVGITCISVENGKRAVEAFERSEPGEYDAILMDIMMPEMDGLEAMQTIRAMERPDAKTIPIFALTANAYKEDMEKSLAAGMNGHFTKPLEMDKILSAIQKFCK
jgi:signal transduction histidine kinase/CheY-like chemotaxis protein